MPKIANTDELQQELRRILAYTHSEQPSRTRIASELQDLGDRLSKTAELNPAPTLGGEEAIIMALDEIYAAALKAKVSASSGNAKRMFFALLGILNGIGTIGRAYDVDGIGYLVRVYKAFTLLSGAKPTLNF